MNEATDGVTQGTQADTGRSRKDSARFWLLIAGAVLLAFLIGFAWQRIRANSIEDRLADTSRALTIARIETDLGAAAIEAMSGSFEIARQHASTFFTQLQAALDTIPPETRPEISQLLSHRDDLITALSRNDVQAGPQLAQMFRRYRSAMGEEVGPTQLIRPAPSATETDTAPRDTPAADTAAEAQ